MNKLLRSALGFGTVMVMFLSSSLASADGPVDPDMVTVDLHPGESHHVDKSVTTPAIPPVVDICLLEDETGSFSDDISNLQGGTTASDLYDTIIASSPGAQLAVAGFRDYPVSPHGGGGDHVYRLLSPMSPVKAAWLGGIGALTASGGGDTPEAQYDAIVAAAGPGPFADPTAGLQNDCGWRPAAVGAQRVLVVAVDSPFHLPGPGKPHVNDQALTVAALDAQGISVLGLKAPGSGPELDNLVAALAKGGSVQALSSDGANIAQAILDGLEELTTDVWWETDCGPELNVMLSPEARFDVPGETTVFFEEWIEVPNDTDPDDYHCTVTFLSNEFPVEGDVLGIEEIWVTVVPIPVPFDIKPQSCPNPLNCKGGGVLPAAILGTADLDVTTIDPSTIKLEGVVADRWEFEDVATPFEPFIGKQDCENDCTAAGPDGFTDLTLKFDKDAVLASLGIPLDHEACLVLTMTGNFADGRAIEGQDVVRILCQGGKP